MTGVPREEWEVKENLFLLQYKCPDCEKKDYPGEGEMYPITRINTSKERREGMAKEKQMEEEKQKGKVHEADKKG